MFQIRDEEESVPSYLEEHHEDDFSIGASEEDGFISEKRQRLTRTCFQAWDMLWLRYSLVASAWIVSIFLAVYVSGQQRHHCEGLSDVLPTELREPPMVSIPYSDLKTDHLLESVQPAVEFQQVRFSGTLEFDDNSTLISTYWDSEAPRYTGEPSDELDAHWNALIYRK